ncbi:TIGR03943 family putative permease subunit [Corynebacterium phocae]|uniref:TIGR03943 family putative permease subunit n=1 Tax=Corynebacterium phocae TaxID=161895 RepID=UPI000A023672|nr:TIGR03943 family protein [Corynebacterium phocae]KAA8721678.1 TIGR03943 family protein [Corynebacterium phocae]
MEQDASQQQAAMAATVVTVFGILLCGVALSGVSNNYLREWFRPFILITGVLLTGLGVWSLRVAKSATGGKDPLHPMTGMLLVPVILAILARPDPLGSAMVTSTAVGGGELKKATNVKPISRSLLAYKDLSATTPNDLTVEELFNRFAYDDKARIEGKPVRVTGFAVPTGGGWMLSRFKIFCCAADAIAYGVRISGAPNPGADSWVTITGTVDTTTDPDLPTIAVSQVEPIPAPEVPYL